MKYLITIFLLICTNLVVAQTATNKIQNMATIMLTNSTLHVGGTNNAFNVTQYAASDIITVYGQDGVIDLVPRFGLIHSRVGIAFYTNNARTISGWSVSQDPLGAQSHEFGIVDNINGVVRLLFVSNATITATIPRFNVSSNLFVSGNVLTSITNDAAFYRVNGIPGFTGSVTNIGPDLGSSNILVYASGLVTNYFKIP